LLERGCDFGDIFDAAGGHGKLDNISISVKGV
jgi:hypothetical protein